MLLSLSLLKLEQFPLANLLLFVVQVFSKYRSVDELFVQLRSLISFTLHVVLAEGTLLGDAGKELLLVEGSSQVELDLARVA